jgi:hypothetical protein
MLNAMKMLLVLTPYYHSMGIIAEVENYFNSFLKNVALWI